MYTQPQSGIINLRLIDAGQFHSLYRRPLEMQISNNMLSVINEVTSGGSNVGSANLAGAASNVLRPSTEPAEAVDIAGGWGQRRLRFVLRMMVHQTPYSSVEQYYSGYTDYTDPSYSGLLDPNMRLHFNSTMQVRENTVQTQFGVTTQRVVNDSSQILAGSYAPSQVISPFMTPGAPASNIHHSMRPGDIFLRIQSDLQNLGPSDTRTMFTNGVKKVLREDTLASNYLSKAIRSYRDVMQKSDYEQDSMENVLDQVSSSMTNPAVQSDPLLSRLHQSRLMGEGGHYTQVNSVTLGELQRLFPNLDSVTEIVRNNNNDLQMLSQTFNGLDAAPWHGRTMEHIAGTIIAESLPALMLTHMVQKFSFKATNKLPPTHFGEDQNQIFVSDIRSVAQLTDMSGPAERLLADMRRQLLPQVSHGGMMPYEISVEADVFGQTVMHIDLGNGFVPLVMPSFADSLASSMIAPNDSYLAQMAGSMNYLVDQVSSVSPQGSLQTIMQENYLKKNTPWAGDPMPGGQTFGGDVADHEAYSVPLQPLY